MSDKLFMLLETQLVRTFLDLFRVKYSNIYIFVFVGLFYRDMYKNRQTVTQKSDVHSILEKCHNHRSILLQTLETTFLFALKCHVLH